MNYRHAFHAGNFADVFKHAVLTALLRGLTASTSPLTVIDTHAGAGLYDLAAPGARRTAEGASGIARLLADPKAPAVFDALKAAVAGVNARGEQRFYPGSPILIARALRTKDRYFAYELLREDHARLKQVLPREAGAVASLADGWRGAAEIAPGAPARLLTLIDPPFERGDDHAACLSLVKRLCAVNPEGVVAIWLPIKDLTTLDSFLGALEDVLGGRALLVAQTRLRPLIDPMRLNGCAMLVVNPPAGLAETAASAASWVAGALGEAGGLGRVEMFGAAATDI
jgi:23S rRNA (adenine2030-N6)-methyltransferase